MTRPSSSDGAPVSDPARPASRLQPILIAGATATGKSEIALRLAERLGGEIVTVDSMQVYRGLDIGTAKPTTAERARVPHHLLDVAGLTEGFDAARFLVLANAAVNEITARQRVPILCGGTGLYFKAFTEGLGEAPPSDPELRATLEQTPLATLLAELQERDPALHATIDQKNPRRVIRALEVIRLTGKPFSKQRSAWQPPHSALRTPHYFGLSRSAEDLRQRINRRVEEMFRQGLVEETRQLLREGLVQNPTAMQAIGYRQVVEHLQGERPLAETIELVKIRTRQFAKRQITWFRKYAPATWIELSDEASLDAAVEQIVAQVKA